SMLLTTEAAVADEPKKDEPSMNQMGGGMPGMM
ncbi:MAG: chaperonin, partial [Sedimentibacter sp.]